MTNFLYHKNKIGYQRAEIFLSFKIKFFSQPCCNYCCRADRSDSQTLQPSVSTMHTRVADKVVVAVLVLLSVILAVLVAVVFMLVSNGSTSAAQMNTAQTQIDALKRTFTQIQLGISNQSAIISNSLTAHTSASFATRMQNDTMNNILGHVVGTGNSLQSSILDTQSRLQQVNESVASIVSSIAGGSPAHLIKTYASACKASFVPDVNWDSYGIGGNCIKSLGDSIFDLGANGTSLSGIVNQPNLTVTFSCSFASRYGQGSVVPDVSVASSSGAIWFNSWTDTACDGSLHTISLKYPGLLTLPTKATAKIIWTWCGDGNPPVTINSMCARIDLA